MHGRIVLLVVSGLMLGGPSFAQLPPPPAPPLNSQANGAAAYIRSPRLLSESGKPVWPKGAQEAGKHGVVEISFDLEKDGSVWRAMVMESSGFSDLDEATLVWARSAKFEPARVQLPGRDVQSTGYRDFRLTFEWRVGQPLLIRSAQLRKPS